MPKIKFICAECGSDDILKDAFARWNTDTQEWELSSTYDYVVCGGCACEEIKEIRVNG